MRGVNHPLYMRLVALAASLGKENHDMGYKTGR
jgi:hypothetical protein